MQLLSLDLWSPTLFNPATCLPLYVLVFLLSLSSYHFLTHYIIQSALCVCGFHISRFNQPQRKTSIFDLLLAIHGSRGPTACIILCQFVEGSLSMCGFGGKGSWNQSPTDIQGTLIYLFFISVANCLSSPCRNNSNSKA